MAYVKAQLSVPQIEDVNGNPAAGYTINSYIWDTSTPTPMYTSSAGAGSATSFTFNSLGQPQTAGGTAIDIFLDSAIVYKFIITDAGGTPVGPTIGPINLGASDALTITLPSGQMQNVEDILAETVSVTRFMNKAQRDDMIAQTAAVDCTNAVQDAIDYCISFDPPKILEIPGKCLLESSVNIDRQVDGATNDNYFTIRGGGFVVDSAINMFSSSIAYTTAPVSQLVKFVGTTFSSTDASLAAYVLHGARFLRTSFVDCNFQKIKCLEDTVVYTQSIYFINCNARRWQGIFFYCNQYNYDIQVIGGMWEAGADAFKLKNPIGCKFLTQIEGMSGTALSYDGAQGMDVCMYNEGNYLDLDGTYGGTSSSTSYGVNLHGSYFAKSPCVISGATQANPVVITTTTAHGYRNGDAVYIVSVAGMTQINDRTFTVANVTSTTFQLQGVNGSAYSAFVNDGNGRVHPYTIKWGATNKCISTGNWHTGAMHNITSATEDLAIYDIAQAKLSDSSEIKTLKSGYSGSFSGTLTGCTTSPTGTVRYDRSGSTVTLYIPSFTAVSDATSCTITGMPAHIRPTRQQICPMRVRDNGAGEYGLCVVDTSGVLDFSRGADGNPFTNSGNKGVLVTTITYSLA